MKLDPAVAVAGAEMTNWDAPLASGPTMITWLVPVIAGLIVSVAVMCWLAAVYIVSVKDPTPWESVESLGRAALMSVVVMDTVPV